MTTEDKDKKQQEEEEGEKKGTTEPLNASSAIKGEGDTIYLSKLSMASAAAYQSGASSQKGAEELYQKQQLSKRMWPERTANPISRIFYSWMDGVFWMGVRRPLELTDMFILPPEYQSKALTKNIQTIFRTRHEQAVQQAASTSQIKADIKRAAKAKALLKEGGVLRESVLASIWSSLVSSAILKFFGDVTNITSPFAMAALVNYVQNPSQYPRNFGVLFAVILFILQFASTVCTNYHFLIVMKAGSFVRTAATGAIYEKVFSLSSTARQEFSTGMVQNMIVSDASRMETFLQYINVFWSSPMQIIVISGFLIYSIGPAALAGLGLIIIFSPFQGVLFKKLSVIRKKVAPIADARIKITQEILAGIRVLKLFTWELPFLKKVKDLRDQEITQIFGRAIIQAFVSTLVFAVPVLCSALSFIIYGVVNPILNPANVFASLTWFGLLRFPLMFLPNVIVGYAEFKVATTRVQNFLLAAELEQSNEKLPADSPYAIVIENADFLWEVAAEKMSPPSPATVTATSPPNDESKSAQSTSAETAPVSVEPKDGEIVKIAEAEEVDSVTLKQININIPKGTLLGICGTVGSGKSSILNAIIGEMKRATGAVRTAGRIGYASQQAWIQNASVRDNILFGRPMDEERYKYAIKACALEADLKILPDGDLTQIGERGVTLSGGQKQRVNLARIVYYNCDIVLLDDPLSAVDAHVGRHLFEECILGALKGKTIVLVTHQLHFLSRVDRIVTIKGGKLVEQGSYEELMNDRGEFYNLMIDYGGADHDDEDDDEAEETAKPAIVAQDAKLSIDEKETKKMKSSKKSKVKSLPPKALMTAEERVVGAVKPSVYMSYFRAAGGAVYITGSIFFLTLYQAARVGSDYWLVTWTNNTIAGFTQAQYIGVYVAWAVAQALFTYLFGIFIAFTGTRASRLLHVRALERVMRAPVLFYDTNPLGRIINRFSKDQDVVDNSLSDALRMFATTLATSVTTFAVIIYTTPIFAAPLVPALIVYYFVQHWYRSTSRELKRLDALTRSPLYAQVGETLTGLSTIRAYEEQPRFILTNQRYLDQSNEPYLLQLVAQRWLGVRLESMGALLVFFAALFGVLAVQWNSGFSPALFGLSLSYAMSVTGVLNWCVRQFAETENAMNAVERLDYYGKDIPVEAPSFIEDHRPPPTWPVSGNIQVKDLLLRYDKDLPLVLKGVSFAVGNKEHVGIVGRTGSGKSSIMQALFRIVEPAGGQIVIDGVDISTIGLTDLRWKLSIIPQDPILFSGSFRKNLDPLDEYPDQEVWDALERANIKSKVIEMGKGLESVIQAGGENLSVGQRQLVCLARAMLKKPKILVLDVRTQDEATANVDFETDSFIQKSLRSDFKEATLLTIAHRLNTIIDYDKVLVLGEGEVIEFGSPADLLSAGEGAFYDMVMQTGASNAEQLIKQAQQAHSDKTAAATAAALYGGAAVGSILSLD